MARNSLVCVFILSVSVAASARTPSDPVPTNVQIFPSSNIWNTPVDNAPLHPNSGLWMGIINGHAGHPLHADFGTLYAGHYNGIPYNIVGNATPLVPVSFNPAANYASESDPLPAAGLPIPVDAIAEGDPPPVDMSGDRHLLLLDVDNNVLHEMFAAARQPDGSWLCAQYSRFDLSSNALRPDGWTSADAAGLPIFPGLVRWDEIQTGAINHALRFTLALTWKPHMWPGRHDAISGSASNPPFGMRVRLKANFDISGYSATNQVILRALKKYGMILADNGGDWFISGAPNPNFNDSDLALLVQIVPNSAFEVVDTSTWLVDPNSAQTIVRNVQTISAVGPPLAPVVFPNPWRADRHSVKKIVFDQITSSATVKIFTASGHLVKTLTSTGTSVPWDLTNDSGTQVASGIYLYVVKTPDGQKARGQVAIIK
jgi:hypothetical protein